METATRARRGIDAALDAEPAMVLVTLLEVSKAAAGPLLGERQQEQSGQGQRSH